MWHALAMLLAAWCLGAILATLAVDWTAQRLADLACEFGQAREGSGYEEWYGMSVDEVRAVARRHGRRIAVREVDRAGSDQSSGSVERVSRCRAPHRADLVVFVSP